MVHETTLYVHYENIVWIQVKNFMMEFKTFVSNIYDVEQTTYISD